MTNRTLDLDTLEVLERVAEAGSLSRAADALGITQQAVSARLRVAERAVGHPLVHRSAAGSTLTENGRLLLGLAAPLLEASRRLEAGLDALRRADGSLVVAASQTIAEMLLPGWLMTFARRAPDTTVRLVAGNSASVIEHVRSGTARLGFVEGPAVPPDLHSVVVAEDEVVIVVAPGHPWAAAASIGIEQLAAEPLLLREEGSGTRATVEARLRAAGLASATPTAVFETTGIIRANARAGVGAAVISLRIVEQDLIDGSLVRVELAGGPLTRRLRAVWAEPPTTAAQEFLAVVRDSR